MERCLSAGNWEGYAGGDAPGLRFETAEWIRSTDIAAICADTWGCEVRPNETSAATQPWHWVVIPMIGISMGEIFYLKKIWQWIARRTVCTNSSSASPAAADYAGGGIACESHRY